MGLIYSKMPTVEEFILFRAYKFKNSGTIVKTTAITRMYK